MVLVYSAGEIERKENIAYCLSLIFQKNTLARFGRFPPGSKSPELLTSSCSCISQVGMVPQADQNLLLEFLPVASLVNILSDFLHYCMLVPPTFRMSK